MEAGKEGGTWFAVSTKGRAGVILNLHTGVKSESNKKGRGTLIPNYLTSDLTTRAYLDSLHEINQKEQAYNPYTLVLMELKNADVYYVSSSVNSPEPQLTDGTILGFGNSTVDCPYTKVMAGKERFKSIVENVTVTDEEKLIEELLSFLKWDKRHLPDPELQERCPTTFEELSAICVSSDKVGYGTRTHSILLVTGSDRMTFVENTLMPDRTWKNQVFNTTVN